MGSPIGIEPKDVFLGAGQLAGLLGALAARLGVSQIQAVGGFGVVVALILIIAAGVLR